MAGNSEAGRLVKIHEQQKSEQGRPQGPRQRKKFPLEKRESLTGRGSAAGYRVSFGISGRDKKRTGRNACAGKLAGNLSFGGDLRDAHSGASGRDIRRRGGDFPHPSGGVL